MGNPYEGLTKDSPEYEDAQDARFDARRRQIREDGYSPRYGAPVRSQGHRTNGPAEGLKAKMDYWRDKDYKYEFGVSVGAAIGNAVASLPRGSSVLDIVNRAKELFSASLKLKKELRAEFDEYFSTL